MGKEYRTCDSYVKVGSPGALLRELHAFLGFCGWLLQACSGLPVPSLSSSVLLWPSIQCMQGGDWSLAQRWRAHGFCWQCRHEARKTEDRTLLRAVSAIHCKSIPLGAQGLVGISVWPAQYGSGLSWRSPRQAAPTTVCTVQEVSPLQGGCKSETGQQHLCTSVLDFSALFLPSPGPTSSVTQSLDMHRVR